MFTNLYCGATAQDDASSGSSRASPPVSSAISSCSHAAIERLLPSAPISSWSASPRWAVGGSSSDIPPLPRGPAAIRGHNGEPASAEGDAESKSGRRRSSAKSVMVDLKQCSVVSVTSDAHVSESLDAHVHATDVSDAAAAGAQAGADDRRGRVRRRQSGEEVLQEVADGGV